MTSLIITRTVFILNMISVVESYYGNVWTICMVLSLKQRQAPQFIYLFYLFNFNYEYKYR